MHVRRTLALAVVAPLLLAGCSDDPEPTPKIPETSTSTPTDEPTATETPESESAEDFIRRWVKAGDEMQVTGETAEYDAMVDETCKACSSFRTSVEEIYAGGGTVDFAGAKVNRIRERDKRPPTFELTKTLPETVIRRGGQAEPETLPAGTTTLLIILKTVSDQWTVRYYGVL